MLRVQADAGGAYSGGLSGVIETHTRLEFDGKEGIFNRHRNHVGQWTLFHLMSRFPLAVQRTYPTSAGALNQERQWKGGTVQLPGHRLQARLRKNP